MITCIRFDTMFFVFIQNYIMCYMNHADNLWAGDPDLAYIFMCILCIIQEIQDEPKIPKMNPRNTRQPKSWVSWVINPRYPSLGYLRLCKFEYFAILGSNPRLGF